MTGRPLRSVASLVAVLAASAFGVVPAGAAQRTAPAQAAKAAADELVVDAGASITVTSANAVFADAAVTAPLASSLRTDGARVRVEGLAGRYETAAVSGRTVSATKAELSGLVGYEWVWSNARLSTFGGVTLGGTDVPTGTSTGADSGMKVGGKLAAQLYVKPGERSMLSAYASYATDRNGYYVHARAGYALFGRFYVGPEAALLGDDTYRQWRLGAHLTGLRLGSLDVSLAGGFMQDQSQKAGGYATVDVRSGF